MEDEQIPKIPKIVVAGVRIADPIEARLDQARLNDEVRRSPWVGNVDLYDRLVVEEIYSGPIDDLYETNPEFFMKKEKQQLDQLQELFRVLGLPRLTRIRAVLFRSTRNKMETMMSSWIAYNDEKTIGWYKYEGWTPGSGRQTVLFGKKAFLLSNILAQRKDFVQFMERAEPLIAALNAAEGQLALAAPYRSEYAAMPNFLARLPDVLREQIVHFLRSPRQVQRIQFPLIKRMLQIEVLRELSDEEEVVQPVAARGRGRPRGSRSRGRALAADRVIIASVEEPVARGRPRGRPRGSKAKPKQPLRVVEDVSSDDEPLIRFRREIVGTATARVKVDRWFQAFQAQVPFHEEDRTEENRNAYRAAFEAFIRERVGELDNVDEVVHLGNLKVNQYIQTQWSGKRNKSRRAKRRHH
jgi:hypothetical protein